MEQFTDELKKVLKAGLGAMATGMDKAQEAIETLAQKGEPIYEQAKAAMGDAADKIKKAVNSSGIADAFTCRPKVEDIINDLNALCQDELDEVRKALEEIYPTRPRTRQSEPEAEDPGAAEDAMPVPEKQDGPKPEDKPFSNQSDECGND